MLPGTPLLLVPVAGNFSDPDGDLLTFSVVSSNASLATATMIGNGIVEVQRVPGKNGVVTVTVTANDGKGGTVWDAFQVTMPALPPLIVIDPTFMSGMSFPITGPGPFSIPLQDAIKDLNGGVVTFSNFQITGTGVDRVEVIGKDLFVYRKSDPGSGFATVTFDYTDSLGITKNHSWSFMIM